MSWCSGILAPSIQHRVEEMKPWHQWVRENGGELRLHTELSKELQSRKDGQGAGPTFFAAVDPGLLWLNSMPAKGPTRVLFLST